MKRRTGNEESRKDHKEIKSFPRTDVLEAIWQENLFSSSISLHKAEPLPLRAEIWIRIGRSTGQHGARL